MKIEGRGAIVTGGSSGIGKAVAKLLAQHGANVFLIARRGELLQAALAEVQKEAVSETQRFGCFTADVSDSAAVQEATRAAEAECGPTAVLINSAGIVRPGYVEKLPIADMEAEIKINYLGTVYMIKQILDGMMERRSGWILNVSSLGGLKGIFGYAGYSGSKFAVVGFSEALRSELRPYGITVSVLCPPDVDTPTFEEENKVKPPETSRISEGGKVMQPEDVARTAMSGLAKGSFIIIPNTPGKLFRFANGVAPSLLDWLFDRTIDKVREERGV